jgi:hemerythrin
MSLFEWSSELSVKVKEIDLQHQNLVGLINKLHHAMKNGEGRNIVGNIIKDLVNYTETHFKTEERFFEMYGYPEAENHKKEHASFVEKISKIKSKYEQGRTTLSVEVMVFLSDWLRKHIKGTDMRYSRFFNENGLE